MKFLYWVWDFVLRGTTVQSNGPFLFLGETTTTEPLFVIFRFFEPGEIAD
jgi:hypothetical protein